MRAETYCRMEDEYEELNDRCLKMTSFRNTVEYELLDSYERHMFDKQLSHMLKYWHCLVTRLDYYKDRIE